MTGNTARILMTGHRGYIGSVVAPYLISQGYEVVGIDTGYYDECVFVPDPAEVESIRLDVRELRPEHFKGFNAVVHLAALSNDPIGNLDERWTDEINNRASVRLAELAKRAGVRRFLFSSSCIMYGASDAAICDENAPLAPRTIYARSKVASENSIRELADDNFSPVFLRNGTVYGVSPRMRFDTVLNNLAGGAFTTGTVTVVGDGTPWRPVVHVEDVARAFQAALEAPAADVHNQAFNTGAEHLNHQIVELAHIVADVVPGCKLEVLGSTDADQRTYRADFSKFARTFPAFEFLWTARNGAQELIDTFARIGLKLEDFTDPKFTRLAWLRYLLVSGALDSSLRWAAPVRVGQ
ncbi:MAG: SDR family oxidoreductase [Acidimicrobiales bacterium]|jgi:nucleoside-diphosphate-sugar epimerase